MQYAAIVPAQTIQSPQDNHLLQRVKEYAQPVGNLFLKNNIPWTPEMIYQAQKYGRQHFRQFKLITLSGNKLSKSNYQPG
eukprot:686972-Ditylum_brightwellii.AAC.1